MISASAAIALSKLAVNPLARANHTGTQTASTISDFDTQVRTSRLDQMAVPTADVSMNGQTLTNLADPTNAQDGATKSYVDTQVAAVAAGLDFKDSAKVLAVADGNLSTDFAAGSVVDGQTLITGWRIVLAGQTAAEENGIYLVNASGAPTRTADADATGEISPGALIYIELGTSHGNQLWICTATSADPWVPNTSTSTWSQFMAGGTVSVNAPLSMAGNVISLDYGTGLDVVSGDLVIDTDVVVRKYATTIGDGTTTAFTVSHNLGTRDVIVQIRRNASPYNLVMTDVKADTINDVVVEFSAPPATNEFRVMIQG